MKVSQRSKQRQELTKSQDNQGLSLSSLLGQILIYSGVLVNLLLSFYNFKSNGFPIYNFKSNGFPSWTDTNRKAWKAEARQLIGGVNQAQKAYYLKENAFADSMEKLGVTFKPDTYNYSYRILSPMVPFQNLDKLEKSAPYSENVMAIAQSKNPKYNSYIGAVYTQKVTPSGIAETMTIGEICEIDSELTLPSTLPTLTNGVIQCPSGSKPLGRP